MTEYEHQAVASSIRKYHWEIFSMSFLMYLLYSGNLKRRNVPSPLRLNNNISKTQKKDPSLSEKWKSIEFHVFHYFFFSTFFTSSFLCLGYHLPPTRWELEIYIFFYLVFPSPQKLDSLWFSNTGTISHWNIKYIFFFVCSRYTF